MRRIIVLALCLITLGSMAIVWAAPARQETEFDLFIFNLRTDMEFLADEVFGAGERPANWTYEPTPDSVIAVIDYSSTTLASDLWFDGEQLADAVFGDTRPPGWFGANTTEPELLARNVRHDLELTADEVLGSTLRPQEWIGAAPLFRCGRTLQNLVRIAEAELITLESTLNYCSAVGVEFMSVHLPNILDQAGGIDNLDTLAWWLRGDLERLMDELLGVGNRPVNWIGNVELGSPQMLEDVNRDLERLASDEFTPDVRPPGWLPYVPTAPSTSYINLRNNLEILTDVKLGEGVRPTGWQGRIDDPLSLCNPLDRAFIEVTRRVFNYTIDEEIYADSDFCAIIVEQATFSVENIVEEQLVEDFTGDVRYVAESRNAFSYLDVAASDYMGIMPWGTIFRAWYRNFAGSNMMFVSGDNFAVYIDRRWTTMSEEVFNTLDTLEDIRPLTFCDAVWCNGPGPTPTPTGSSPLELLLFEATIPPTPIILEGGIVQVGKAQVSWNHVRVTYVGDFPERSSAQVALEICVEPQQITCEPVTSVYDNRIGVPKPVLFQTNGLNVYEIEYGYINNLLIEGPTLVSPDVFISDPTIR